MILLRRGKIFVLFLVFLISGVLGLFHIANAQAASIYFSPSSGQHTVGETFLVAVRVNTDGVAINAAEGSIVFDTAKLDVVSISKSGSIFSLWTTEPTFSNSDGTINFGGGVPNPGYSGSNGVILTIKFKAQTSTTIRGYTDVVLVSGAVLANDGEGTNILSSLGKYTTFIGAAAAPAAPSGVSPAVPTAGILTPIVKSSTHPDPTKWYAIKDADFNWEVPAGVKEVWLALDRDQTKAPHVRYSPPISEKLLPSLDDGVWYLNVQFRTSTKLGPISSFKFQIDTKPPQDFQVNRVDADINNPRPELLFSTTDDTSGIDHYEIKVGEGDWFTVDKSTAGKPYSLPPLKSGDYKVTVKAVDGAGNSATSSVDITVLIKVSPLVEKIANLLSNIFDWVVNILSRGGLFIGFLAALIGLLISLAKLFERKIKTWWNALNQQRILKATEKKSLKKVGHIIEDMRQELKFLESISRRRRLGPEESYLKNKIAQYIKALKNLEDIEDKS